MKLFVSCNPTLTPFYSKKYIHQSFFSALPTPNQRKTCIKHIFGQKNNAFFFINYQPTLLFQTYVQETNNIFSWPNGEIFKVIFGAGFVKPNRINNL